MKHHTHKKPGQAIVEFALASTLIFLLLAAAVDLGLIFLTVQGLHNSAQEAASYGSRWLVTCSPNGIRSRCLDRATIIDRARHESGNRPGFANLLDLNSDGVEDDAGTYNQFIEIQLLVDKSNDGDPTLNKTNSTVDGVAAGGQENATCDDPSSSRDQCYIRVTVRKNYHLFFPFTPAFANETMLQSSYVMALRDSYSQGSGGDAGVFQPMRCVVPNLVGQTRNNAETAWRNSRFSQTLDKVRRNSNQADFTVASQSVAAGSTVDCSTSMTISD